MMETVTQAAKILVAEDEPDIAKIVRYLLESKGHQVTICPDGSTALKTIPDIKPDLLILDVMMPKMSGYALVKELKKDEEFSGIPILMVSGISRGSDKPDSFWQKGMNVDDYITKPFEPKDLIQRVENLLRKKREGWLDKDRTEALESAANGSSGSMSVKDMPVFEDEVPASPVQKEPDTPEAVVRTFVESWNKQTFDAEYQCLAQRMCCNTSQAEYVQRRRGYYAETNGKDPHRQSIQKIISSKVSGNNAQVDIVRLDTEGARQRIARESYILILEDGKWKINSVKSGSQ